MMTNEEKDELQRLAEELAGLDRDKDSARAAAIKEYIVDLELSELQNICGKAYFPLLKKSNGMIEFDEFYDIFVDALMGLFRNYNPEKAKFATALSYLLNRRINDYWRKKMKRDGRTISMDIPDEEGNYIEIPDQSDFVEDILRSNELSEWERFLRISTLIALRMEQEKHLPEKKKSFFEGFYTYDTNVQTKKGLFTVRDVLDQKDILFPLMEWIMLNYLLIGNFDDMESIIKSTFRDEKFLDHRSQTIRDCYEITKTKLFNRNERYFQLFKAINE